MKRSLLGIVTIPVLSDLPDEVLLKLIGWMSVDVDQVRHGV